VSFSLITPVLTPFNKDMNIDMESLENHCRTILKYVNQILIYGTSGEWPCLSLEERISMLRTLSQCIDPEKIIVGVHLFNTKEVMRLVDTCKEYSIRTIISLPPLYYKPTEETFQRYYSLLCEKFERQVMIYLYSDVQGYEVPPHWIEKVIEEYENITGIKVTSRDYKYVINIMRNVKRTRNNIRVYIGNGYYATLHRLSGGDGVIDIFLNVIPQIYVEIAQGKIDQHKRIIEAYDIAQGCSLIRFCKSILKSIKMYREDTTRFISREVDHSKVKRISREVQYLSNKK